MGSPTKRRDSPGERTAQAKDSPAGRIDMAAHVGSFGQFRGVPPGGLYPGIATFAAELDVTGNTGNSFGSGANTPDSAPHTPASYRSHQFSRFAGVPRIVSSAPPWSHQFGDQRFADKPDL